MRKNRFGKRGSYAVYLVMFFAGIMILISAVLKVSYEKAVDESVENLGRLWGMSILGEYDIELRERYGLYGYFGNNPAVSEKIDRYADRTFGEKKQIKCEKAEVSLDGFRLSDPEIFSMELRKTAGTFLGRVPPKEKEPGTETDAGNRTITARWILDELPSHKYNGKSSASGGPSDSVLQINYIFKVFKDHVDDKISEKTYFRNEIEYIITGKPDDEAARKGVYTRLLLMRNGLNLTYLYSSEEKREAALAAAELLTPGPGAVVTQGLLLESWALLEARNDMALLYDGKKVPLVKEDENWALSLDTVIEKEYGEPRELDTEEEKKYVSPSRIEGQEYSEYLKTLLISVGDTKRLLRIMDLIQINMKYTYCGYFLMDDFYTGLDYSMEVNGRRHEFTESYF